MSAENETPDSTEETDSENTEEIESTDSDSTDSEGETDTSADNDDSGDSSGDSDADSGNDDLSNATAMIVNLQASNSQMLTENSIKIEELQNTITNLRAELWTATRVLPNDSVSTDAGSDGESAVTFDDLVAKATAKESE